MKRIVLMLGVATALGIATPAAAQKGGNGGSDEINLRVCNNSQDVAQVAVSYMPVGSSQFYNEGWYNVDPYQCEILATTTNAFMYAYAEVEGEDDTGWFGEHALCVEYPGPYGFWTSPTSECESWQELRNFVVLHAEDYGVFTWDLDP